MTTMNIVIQRKEDVEDFVSHVSKLPCDVNLTSGRFVIDAKSILGVLGLGVGRILKVEANTDNADYVKDVMQKYMVS